MSIKRTITPQLKSLNIKIITTFDVGNPGPSLGQAQKCGRAKQVKWNKIVSIQKNEVKLFYVKDCQHQQILSKLNSDPKIV